MLMEILFCIIFFILPLAGMCAALVINAFQAENTNASKQVKNSLYISSQFRMGQIRGAAIKIEDKHPKYFFKHWRNKFVKSYGFLDTS